MVRIVLLVAMLALTVYAAADWHRTPEEEMPGKLPKPVWLLTIVWLGLRWVARAEKAQSARASTHERPTAPDDDPDFLFRLERDIQRKRREDERRRRDEHPGEDSSAQDPEAGA